MMQARIKKKKTAHKSLKKKEKRRNNKIRVNNTIDKNNLKENKTRRSGMKPGRTPTRWYIKEFEK